MLPAMGFLARFRALLAFKQNLDAFIEVLHDSLEDRPPPLCLGVLVFKFNEKGSGEFTPRDVPVLQDKERLDSFETEFQLLKGLDEPNSKQGFMIIETKTPTAPAVGTDEVKLLIVPDGSERHTGSLRYFSNLNRFVFVAHKI